MPPRRRFSAPAEAAIGDGVDKSASDKSTSDKQANGAANESAGTSVDAAKLEAVDPANEKAKSSDSLHQPRCLRLHPGKLLPRIQAAVQLRKVMQPADPAAPQTHAARRRDCEFDTVVSADRTSSACKLESLLERQLQREAFTTTSLQGYTLNEPTGFLRETRAAELASRGSFGGVDIFSAGYRTGRGDFCAVVQRA